MVLEFTLTVKWIFLLYLIILNNPYPVKIKPNPDFSNINYINGNQGIAV